MRTFKSWLETVGVPSAGRSEALRPTVQQRDKLIHHIPMIGVCDVDWHASQAGGGDVLERPPARMSKTTSSDHLGRVTHQSQECKTFTYNLATIMLALR